MDKTLVIYLVFGAVIIAALAFDLGLLSKKNKVISLRTALLQTTFWVILSLGFCGFIWIENANGNGHSDAVSYISAYLLEWSDRKSTRLNSSHVSISYAVFCLK